MSLKLWNLELKLSTTSKLGCSVNTTLIFSDLHNKFVLHVWPGAHASAVYSGQPCQWLRIDSVPNIHMCHCQHHATRSPNAALSESKYTCTHFVSINLTHQQMKITTCPIKFGLLRLMWQIDVPISRSKFSVSHTSVSRSEVATVTVDKTWEERRPFRRLIYILDSL